MAVELKVPEVGESITEVFIGEWLKSEGDTVEKDEALVEVETDKATLGSPRLSRRHAHQSVEAAGRHRRGRRGHRAHF